jgi:phosphoribosylanthranilate isomerase
MAQTRIKVCGITRAEDALAAAGLGVHALGFVFWPSSPRAVSVDQARAIIAALPPFVMSVGVFVDPSAHLVASCHEAGIHVAQIVGAVPALPRGMMLLPVVSLAADGSGIAPAVPGHSPVLIDAHDPVRRGGTGQTIDWGAVAPIARKRPVVLAGGLRAENVADAVTVVRPAGVDVSSGVEQAPGVKDHQKLAAFVAAVRTVR